jgi:hypothetical protein
MTLGNPKLSSRKVLLAEIESSYGVDVIVSNPMGAHGILASNFTFTPMAATATKRQRAYQNWGGDPSEITQKHAMITFDVEAAGSGAAGTAPLFGPLLRCCNLEETIVAATSASYTPLTGDTESTSLHFYQDSLYHRLTGCRGTVSLKMSGGGLPMWSFAITGLWNAAADGAPPDVHADLEAFIDASEVNLANTTFTLFGQAVVLDSLQIDLGNSVEFRDRPNAAYVAVTNRVMTGKIVFEAPTVATYDWETAAAIKTTGALALLQGTTAGDKLQIAATRVQIENPSYADQNGVLCLSANINILRTAGDDEITFTIK